MKDIDKLAKLFDELGVEYERKSSPCHFFKSLRVAECFDFDFKVDGEFFGVDANNDY